MAATDAACKHASAGSEIMPWARWIEPYRERSAKRVPPIRQSRDRIKAMAPGTVWSISPAPPMRGASAAANG